MTIAERLKPRRLLMPAILAWFPLAHPLAAERLPSPRIEVVTEGVFGRMILDDPSLDGIGVIELQSLGSNGNLPSVTVGLLTATGAGSFSISADQNQGGTMGTLCTSGSYSVSATTGRVMLSNVEQCGGGSSGGGVPVFYLVGPNQAFVVGTDGAATFGARD